VQLAWPSESYNPEKEGLKYSREIIFSQNHRGKNPEQS
jgi:hypothetical protein